MSSDSNIIAFPKKRLDTPFSIGVDTEEDVKERVQAVHQIHVDNVLDAIVDTIIQQLIVSGFDVDEDESIDVSFVAESLRSLMTKQYGIFHPFHDLVEKTMVEDEDGVFQIRDISTQHNEEQFEEAIEKVAKAVTEDSRALPSRD